MENYSSLIRTVMKVSDSELSEVCINVVTQDYAYPFSFLEYEDEEHLGIYYTAEDFSERFVILNKKYIISVGIVYKQDLILEIDENDDIPMFE